MSRRTRQVVTTVITLALLLAVWWIQNRSPEEDGTARGRDDASVSTTNDGKPAPERSGQSGESGRGSDSDGFPYVAVDQLPAEAAEVLELIDDGGPFEYPDKDGSTFGNFEGLLPDRQRGYYAEYTVETPGLSHRGARRIIAGDGGELYWTEDHYESFERIRR